MSISSHLILDYNHLSATPVYTPSASVLKPIIVWLSMKKLATLNNEQTFNIEDYQRIIQYSDNLLTDKLVTTVLSLEEATRELNNLLPDHLSKMETPETWGRFKVSGAIVFALYKALIADGTTESETVLSWMKDVTDTQRFGIDSAYAVKAGWDLTEQSQLILLLVKIDGANVKVLTATSDQLTVREVDLWKDYELTNPTELSLYHSKFFPQELKTFHSLSK